MTHPFRILCIRAAALPPRYHVCKSLPDNFTAMAPTGDLPGIVFHEVDESVDIGSYEGHYYEAVYVYSDTSSAERAYSLCDYWKMKGAWVLLSGPHPERMGQEALTHADTLVRGSVTALWTEIVEDIHKERLKRKYQGPELPQIISSSWEWVEITTQADLDYLKDNCDGIHFRKKLAGGRIILGQDNGFDPAGETLIKSISESGLDLPLVNIYTPLPGSDEYTRLDEEGRILERRYHFYDGRHVVFQPRDLSPGELMEGYDKLIKAVYRRHANNRLYGGWEKDTQRRIKKQLNVWYRA